MDRATRFFVSFSSRDLSYVREIMAALKGQDIDCWNYSDIIQSIELGEEIDERLVSEIDTCTQMIVVISHHSVDPGIGKFCRFEMEYVRNRQPDRPKMIPVLIGRKGDFELQYPYDVIDKSFCFELDSTPESIVKLTVRISQLAEKTYVPPIEAHPSLPFWKLFRKEVEALAHSSKDHIELMMILGEFNEYYKKSDLERAHFLISYFIQSCKYRVPDYQPFYPVIVQAVCETELGKLDDALISYEQAKLIRPEDQDAIGGLGTVYFKKGEYARAAECFAAILRNPGTEDLTNAWINLIITKLAMDQTLDDDEAGFLFQVDISGYATDLQTNILNARGIYLLGRKRYEEVEKLCSSIREIQRHDTITIRLLQLSLLQMGRKEDARRLVSHSIKESEINPSLNPDVLRSYFEDM